MEEGDGEWGVLMPVGDDDGREARRTPRRDYQVELGTTGLLALFCSLAVMCGVFFAFGYTLGKHAVPATFSLGGDDNNGGPGSGLNKPAPGAPLPVPVVPAPTASSEVQPPNPVDLTAAEDSSPAPSLQPETGADGSVVETPKAPKPHATKPESTPADGSAVAPPATPPAAARPPAASGSYSVQVFAGTKEDDARALAAALKGKQYPVFILRPGQVNGDQLYRVQVGPFSSAMVAEATRSRLTADGYTAILKH